MTITGLTTDQKQQVRELLERDVPVSKIKDDLGLDDADLIYDALDFGVGCIDKSRPEQFLVLFTSIRWLTLMRPKRVS